MKLIRHYHCDKPSEELADVKGVIGAISYLRYLRHQEYIKWENEHNRKHPAKLSSFDIKINITKDGTFLHAWPGEYFEVRK